MTDSESIRVTRSVVVPRSEIELRTSRSSGPGGQHAQKSETRVEAVFDVEASSALSDAQKRRVVAKAGPVLRAIAQDERSQLRNKELAIERVIESLREALRVPRHRVPTKPSAASRERRLEQKKRRSQVKRLAPAAAGLSFDRAGSRKGMQRKLGSAIAGLLVLAGALAPIAAASDRLALNASHVSLAVSADGKLAVVTYRQGGRVRHALVGGAINALPPSETRAASAVRDRLDGRLGDASQRALVAPSR